MTAFFVPGIVPGEQTHRAYEQLRAYAEARTGRAPRPEHIYSLLCRRTGADTEARVGEPDPCDGSTVLAIFADREGYVVVWEDGHAQVGRHEAYEAVAFD
jgi:hypothetical protein